MIEGIATSDGHIIAGIILHKYFSTSGPFAASPAMFKALVVQLTYLKHMEESIGGF